MSTPSGDESLDLSSKVKEEGTKLKNEAAKEGVALDDGDPTFVTPMNEGSIGAHSEVVTRYDPSDQRAVKGVIELIQKMNDAMLNKKLAIGAMEGCFVYDNDVHDVFGPACMSYDHWIGKIKKAFDPNLVGEGSFYITPKEELK
jgi:hypothetical protein